MPHRIVRQKYVTGYILTGGWVVALVTGIITEDYQALVLVSPAWLIYIGFLFGDRVVFNKGQMPQ
jgi:hypothetical protein